MAKLEAFLLDGTLIGSVDFNLASFAVPDRYKKDMKLQNTANGVGSQSYISVEVKTSDG